MELLTLLEKLNLPLGIEGKPIPTHIAYTDDNDVETYVIPIKNIQDVIHDGDCVTIKILAEGSDTPYYSTPLGPYYLLSINE